ncbi:MAG: PKD domain-containing protein [Bacteroidia bacterium]
MRRHYLILLLLILSNFAKAQNVLLEENFDNSSASSPPTGWTEDIISGSSILDHFIFSDTLYHFPKDIEGSYALFDCYNGGTLGATNSNGQGEEVALISPIISTHNLNSLHLTFNYFLTSFSGAGLYVDVSTNGTSWTQVFSRTGTTSSSYQTNIVLNSYLNKDKFQIRLRWKNSKTANNQGYGAFDNIKLLERFSSDISVEQIELASPSACAMQSHGVKVIVKNEGLTQLNNVPVRLELSGVSNSVFLDTINSINSLNEVSLSIGSIYMATSGKLYAKAIIELPDSFLTNNELIDSIQTASIPGTPKGTDGSRCGAGQVDVYASSASNEFTYWFEQSSGGKYLDEGEEFTTPRISKTTDFYAENVIMVDGEISTFQGPWRYNGSPTGGSYFDITAKRQILIDSLSQLCAYSSNNVVFTVYYKDGAHAGYERTSSAWTVIAKDTINTPGWGKYITIDIEDIMLYHGETAAFYITVNGSASPTFKQQALDKEYNDFEILAEGINNIAFGNPLNGYSWDGKVHYQNLCNSPREEITAVILPKPAGSYFVTHEVSNGVFNHGNLTKPDVVAVDESISYQIAVPDGSNWADYGNSWDISGIELLSVNGHQIPSADSTIAYVDSGQLLISYTPSSNWLDSTVVLRSWIRSLENFCDTVIERHIRIAPTPQLEFTAEDICFGELMHFKNKSTISSGYMNYKWLFGDGDSSEQIQAIHEYKTFGVFNVKLQAVTDLGIVNELTRTVEVYEIPKVDFSVRNACEGFELEFGNKSSISSGLINYRWTFGDGQETFDHSTSHEYAETGEYLVTLIAEANGCFSSLSQNAYQFPNPVASFTTSGQCQFSDYNLISTSTIKDNSSIGHLWIIDNQVQLTGNNANYQFQNSGNHELVLVASSQFGCIDSSIQMVEIDPSPVSHFSFDMSCDKTPTQFTNLTTIIGLDTVSYYWDFGDGNSTTEFSPLHQFKETGSVDVKLIASSNKGCTSEFLQELSVGSQPVANFEIESGCSGELLSFVNTTSNTFGIIDFHWEFGDGNASQDFAPKHSYDVEQNTIFNVMLTASSSNGCFTEFSKALQIAEAPNCGFEFEQSSEDRQLFTFTPSIKEYEKYTWLFEGDGVSFEKEPIHRFTYPDWKYKVSLVAETKEGCTCNDEFVYVYTSWTASVDRLLDGSDLLIYPNPASEVLILSWSEATNPNLTAVALIDAQGRIVQQWDYSQNFDNNWTLDLSAVGAGSYRIEVKRSNGISIHQIIIN